MKSVMTHNFARVQGPSVPRTAFNRSSGYKTTFNAGDLVPIYVDEILPGDTWSVRAGVLARLNTPIVPVMDNLYMDTFWFAVPYRLVWDNWQRFNGEQPNPGDSTDFLIPQRIADSLGFREDSLGDYFGLPTKVADLSVNALPFRAYSLVWNEWFRDQNLQSRADVPKGDGPDYDAVGVSNATYPLKRNKRHDYFTSCLPWPQKGTSVPIPISQNGSIISNNTNPTMGQAVGQNRSLLGNTSNVLNLSGTAFPSNAALIWGNETGLQLSTTALGTINALRQSFQIQKMLERDARGGTRYTEVLRAHFGVTSPDARLQRPEYLGGGRTAVNFHPVTQTSSTDAETPQGNLAAFATASGMPGGFTKSFTEHCILLGLACVSADLNYQQGVDRMWSRRTRYDHYWPSLAHLGEQAVLNKEINGAHTTPLGVWGYQERYGEYRFKRSYVTGKFRSNATGPLDFWHLSQNLGNTVALNSGFIEENPPIDRVVATPTEPDFKMDCYFETRTVRPMPMYGTPGDIDRF